MLFNKIASTSLLIFSLIIHDFFIDDLVHCQSTTFPTSKLEGERIFFVKKQVVENLKLGDIYSMDPTGGDVQRLTNFSQSYAWAELPQLSWDGTKLGFISNYESWKSMNYIDAFLADLNDGTVSRITGHEKRTPTNNTATVNVSVNYPQNYVISPSAIRISYKGCSSFVTGNTATLTVPADEEIWIKAEVAKAKGDYKTLNLPAGGNQSITLNLTNGTLSAESCFPSYNGSFLAVSENSEAISNSQGQTFSWYKVLIWDAKKKEEVTEVGGFKMGGDINPAYSPNDQYLAMCTGEQVLQSLGIVQTSNISAIPTILARSNYIGYHAYCTSPAWSPSGNEIAYVYVVITTTFMGTEIQSNIFTVSTSGGEPKQITLYSDREVATKPCYSPDGSKIAFTLSKSNGNVFTLNDYITGNYISNIHVISRNGGTTTAVTTDGNSFDPAWGVISSTVDVEKLKDTPRSIKLYQNYPNPFNPATKIQYNIPVAAPSSVEGHQVTLVVYDILGRRVTTLVNHKQIPGNYEVEFNASSLNRHIKSGVYFYQLIIDDYKEIKKMILIK